jgi:hypothetical protein
MWEASASLFLFLENHSLTKFIRNNQKRSKDATVRLMVVMAVALISKCELKDAKKNWSGPTCLSRRVRS